MHASTRFAPFAAMLLFAFAACDDNGNGNGASQCSTPDPSRDACSVDTDCADGQRCIETGQCRSSSCSCDSGAWVCTDDCGPKHECVTPKACTEPNPADKGCSSDLDCPTGETCNMQQHAPIGCTCDSISGQWVCTEADRAACGPPPVCGVDPSKDGCYDDENCAAGETCQPVEGCRPGTCTCDEASKTWGCSKDCQPYHACTR